MVSMGDSNSGSLDCEPSILPLSYRAPRDAVLIIAWDRCGEREDTEERDRRLRWEMKGEMGEVWAREGWDVCCEHFKYTAMDLVAIISLSYTYKEMIATKSIAVYLKCSQKEEGL